MLRRCLLVLLTTVLASLPSPAQRPGSLRPGTFAIRDARVVVEPGRVLEKATVVIRDGVIEAVGAEAKAPAAALVIDGKGLTVYAGFLDAHSTWGFDPALRRSEAGPPAAEDYAAEALAATKPDNRKGLTPEFEVAAALRAEDEVADNWRRIGFTAHLVAADGGIFTGRSALVSVSGAPPREALLRSAVFQHAALRTATGGEYPRSLMGTVAHVRQFLLDAQHNRRLWERFEKAGGQGKRPPTDASLAALVPAFDRKQSVAFEVETRDSVHRALDFAAEFDLQPVLLGGGDLARVAERLKQEKVPVLLRLNFTDQPRQRGRGSFTVDAPDGEPAVPKRVTEDRQRQLKEEMRAAFMLQKEGIPFAFATSGQIGDKPWERFRDNLRKVIAEGLPPEAALRALTTDAAQILGVGRQLGRVEPGKAAHLLVTDGDFHDPQTQVHYVFADGVRFTYETKPKQAAKPPESKKPEEPAKTSDKVELPTEIEADRKPRTRTGGDVLIKGATILTVTNGTVKGDVLVREGKIAAVGPDVKVPGGSDSLRVIDAAGLFVMPGIIDTHSHFGISGGVNETSLSVVPEVRVRDVIDGEDVSIYRALAGGVTASRLLHGSANVVGGQDAVIKLKYGEPARKLLLADAPRGVKFALGENVKRTDGRFPNTRLGVEAVLVRAFSEAKAYAEAREAYLRALKRAGTDSLAPPEPRRDLRLEALADVLRGDLKVHSHCYRSDEILMLLRTADRFGFKVRSLQHVLEGYKIAAEIADHGASNSTFSDWWAYKLEAYDAIPFNAALLHEAGASVCLKSDSNELMRHLYAEAAKLVKYGGLSETEALATVTINPAKQLGLEKRIGSIEVGKDADLAIFNGHPLNGYARCEMTLVEGEVYFQRSDKLTPFEPAAAGPAKKSTKPLKIEANPDGVYLVRGVTVHLEKSIVPGPAELLIANGRFVRPPWDDALVKKARVIDLTGQDIHAYPGMIDAGTVLGLTELGSARETQDFAEGGDFQPDLRASVGINPDSELIPVTRANGVLSVVTRPTGATLAGQSALNNLNGWVPREMAVTDPLALHVEFPTPAPSFSGDPTLPMVGRAIARKQREEKVRRLKELFAQALAHDAARKQDSTTPANPRLEALVPYARGEKPVVIQANRRPEIVEALKFADDLKLKVILSGAIDAWKVTAELKKRDVPVIVGPMTMVPQEGHDPYDAPYACPAKLHEAGVRFCIRSAGTTNTRNLPYEAAMAVSYGLPPEEGLKAVTLYPAQILGAEKELGSIESGKRANLVLADGDLLQATTQVKLLFIDGKPLEPASKHTRLYERYRERLREVKEGRAPLGTK
jgi:imidazolonepropionase-like amidohydrolase